MKYYAKIDSPFKASDTWYSANTLTVLAGAFEEDDEVIVAKANPCANAGRCNGKRIEGIYYRKKGGKLKKLNQYMFFGLELAAQAMTEAVIENPL